MMLPLQKGLVSAAARHTRSDMLNAQHCAQLVMA